MLSRATLGLVRVREWRADETRAVGSLMKCFDDIVDKSRPAVIGSTKSGSCNFGEPQMIDAATIFWLGDVRIEAGLI